MLTVFDRTTSEYSGLKSEENQFTRIARQDIRTMSEHTAEPTGTLMTT